MRNDIITKINNLFDENTNLKVRNEYLENYKEEREHIGFCETKGITILDEKLIDLGKNALVEKTIKSWNIAVYVSKDEKTNEIKITSYDRWLEKKIQDSSIPNNMSKEEVMNAIYDYDIARKIYEEEKVKAIKNFEEKEKDENE